MAEIQEYEENGVWFVRIQRTYTSSVNTYRVRGRGLVQDVQYENRVTYGVITEESFSDQMRKKMDAPLPATREEWRMQPKPSIDFDDTYECLLEDERRWAVGEVITMFASYTEDPLRVWQKLRRNPTIPAEIATHRVIEL